MDLISRIAPRFYRLLDRALHGNHPHRTLRLPQGALVELRSRECLEQTEPPQPRTGLCRLVHLRHLYPVDRRLHVADGVGGACCAEGDGRHRYVCLVRVRDHGLLGYEMAGTLQAHIGAYADCDCELLYIVTR